MTIGTTSTLQFPHYTLLKPSCSYQLLTRGGEKRQETGIQIIIIFFFIIIIIIIIKIYTSAYEHTMINTMI